MRFGPDAMGFAGLGLGVDPGYQLHLNRDSAAKPTSNTWTIVSDQRIKDNIILADTDRCYDIIKTLPLKRFTWKNSVYSDQQINDRSMLGWVAQDVQTVFPKAVTITPQLSFAPIGLSAEKVVVEDCMSLNSDQIYAAMYGAIQKLITVVETQTATISTLETRIQQLESNAL
jgi:hypothetical protein